MSVLLLMYLCTDANRLDCQVITVQRWTDSKAYEQCMESSLVLTKSLTESNRGRHRFVCELQEADESTTTQHAQPTLTPHTFRL